LSRAAPGGSKGKSWQPHRRRSGRTWKPLRMGAGVIA